MTSAASTTIQLADAIAGDDVAHKEALVASFGSCGAKDLAKALAFVQGQEATNAHTQFSFEIAGDPPVSKRPRKAGAGPGGRGGHIYSPDAEDQFTLSQLIRMELPKNYVPMEGEIEIYLHIYRPMPAGFIPYKRLLAEAGYLKPEVKPDWDNFGKILCDAMATRLFRDDSLVVTAQVRKLYSLRPRLEAMISGRPRRMTK